MSGVQIYPNFHSATAAELIAGRWGYLINDDNDELTLFLCIEDREEKATARAILFTKAGSFIRHLNDETRVLLLEGEIEIDLAADKISQISRLRGIEEGTTLFGIYGNDVVLIIAKNPTYDHSDKYMHFNLTENKITGRLDSSGFWWKSASIRYRKDKSREWLTLHTWPSQA